MICLTDAELKKLREEPLRGCDVSAMASALVQEAAAQGIALAITYGQKGARVRHRKTGKLYAVLCRALRESDQEPLIVYMSLDAHQMTWVRPESEFNDGRFERVD